MRSSSAESSTTSSGLMLPQKKQLDLGGMGRPAARDALLAALARPRPFAQGVAILVARILAPDGVVITLRVAGGGVRADQLNNPVSGVPAAAGGFPIGRPGILGAGFPIFCEHDPR